MCNRIQETLSIIIDRSLRYPASSTLQSPQIRWFSSDIARSINLLTYLVDAGRNEDMIKLRR